MNKAIQHDEFLQLQLEKFEDVTIGLEKRLEDFTDITIPIFDDDAMKAAKADVRELRKYKKAIDDKRKELKDPYLNGGRAIDAKAKQWAALIEPVEKARIEAIDKVTREMDAIRRKKAQERTRELTGAGFEFSAGAYRIGTKVVHGQAIDESSDDEWKAIIAGGKEEKERLAKEAEAKRIEDERLAKENAELKAKLAKLEAKEDPFKETSEPKAEAAPTNTGAPTRVDYIPPKTSDRTEMFGDTPLEKPTLYKNGFDAARTLAIAIVQKTSSKKEIINALNELKA